MPLEGHWGKQQRLRRLTKRERNVVAGGLIVTVVAIAILIFAAAGGSQPDTPTGCIKVVVAGKTGGEVVKGCGVEAEKICAHSAKFSDPRSRDVVASCRRQEIDF